MEGRLYILNYKFIVSVYILDFTIYMNNPFAPLSKIREFEKIMSENPTKMILLTTIGAETDVSTNLLFFFCCYRQSTNVMQCIEHFWNVLVRTMLGAYLILTTLSKVGALHQLSRFSWKRKIPI